MNITIFMSVNDGDGHYVSKTMNLPFTADSDQNGMSLNKLVTEYVALKDSAMRLLTNKGEPLETTKDSHPRRKTLDLMA